MKCLNYCSVLERELGGNDFSLHRRNQMILSDKTKLGTVAESAMRLTKTGTTICAAKFRGGVALAADTRSTAGGIVAEKVFLKLHRVSDNIIMAGAGTAADLFHVHKWIKSVVELHRLNTGTTPRVAMVARVFQDHLFSYRGYKGLNVIVGGVDITGPSIYEVYSRGFSTSLPYVATGSGMGSALAVLETGFKDDMPMDEAKGLVVEAIKGGIFNDLGSGGNVDVAVVTKDFLTIELGFKIFPTLEFKKPSVDFIKGTTPILLEHVENIRKTVDVEDIPSEDVEMLPA